MSSAPQEEESTSATPLNPELVTKLDDWLALCREIENKIAKERQYAFEKVDLSICSSTKPLDNTREGKFKFKEHQLRWKAFVIDGRADDRIKEMIRVLEQWKQEKPPDSKAQATLNELSGKVRFLRMRYDLMIATSRMVRSKFNSMRADRVEKFREVTGRP